MHNWRMALCLALAYVLTGYLGLQTPAYGTTITLVWLPTGIAVGFLLRWGYSTWPGIVLGAFLVNVVNGNSVPLAVGISVGNTLGPLLVARLLTAMGFRGDFQRAHEVVLLALAATIGMMASATGGVVCLVLAGELQAGVVVAWTRWWVGDATGVLLSAPFVLTVGREAYRELRQRRAEFAAWVGVIGLSCVVSFVTNRGPAPLPLAFVPLPLVAWVAIRFGPLGTSLGVVLIVFAAEIGTSMGYGPFVQTDSSRSAVLIWVYALTCVVLAWLAAALTAAQKQAQASLHESEERWKFALEGAGAGVIEWDVGSARVLFSERWRALTGYRPGDLPDTFESLTELVHPEDRPHVLLDLDRTLSGAQPVHAVEHRLRCADGRWIWVLSRAIVTRRGADHAPLRVVGTHQDITDRKRAEQALRESETRFRHMAENIPGAIIQYTLRPDGTDRVEYMSPACEDVWEVPAEAVRADSGVHWRMVHPDDLEGLQAAIAEGARQLGPLTHSWRITTPSGRLKWLQVYARPEPVAAGSISWNCAIFDVTAQKRAEAALRESEERFRLAAESTGAGVWDHRMEQAEISFSDQLRAIYGLPPDARITVPVLSGLIHPDDRPAFEQVVAAAADPGGDSTYSIDHRIVRPDGEVRWIHSSGRSFFDSCRNPYRSIGIARDVTAQKATEAALRKSEERYRLLFESNPHPMWVYDLETLAFLAVNDAAVAKYGYSRDEFLARTIADIRPPEDVPAMLESVAATTGGLADAGVWRHRLKDGRLIRVRISGHTLTFAGRPAEFILSQDVTDQLRAEEQLRESEARYRTLFETSTDAIFLLDLAGRIRAANPAAARMHGYTPEELLALRVQDLDLPESATHAPDRLKRMVAGEVLTFEVVHRRKDGTTFPVEVLGSVVEVGGERLVMAFDRDITERKAAEVRQASLATILEESLSEIYIFDRVSLRFLEVNRAARTNLGYELAELREMTPLDLKPAFTADAFDELLAPLRAGRVENLTFETVHRRKNGTTYPVEVHLGTGAFRERSVLVAQIMDITARKQAERREADHMRRLRHVAELSITLSGEPGAVFARVVRMIGELFGVRVVCLSEIAGEELLFRSVYVNGEVFADAGRCPIAVTPCATVQSEKDVMVFDSVADRFPAADFLHRHAAHSYCGFPSLDHEGNVVAVTCLLDDKPHEFGEEDRHILQIIGQRLAIEVERGRIAADRQRAEDALREAEYRQRLALDAGRMGTWDWEIGSDRLDWDDREQALFGFPPGGFDGLLASFLACVHPDDRAALQQVLADAAAGKDFDGEFRIVRPTGEVRCIHGSGTVYPADGDRPARLIGINYDVTLRVQAEEQLRDSIREKEAMLKEIHHRVKNNLQVISSLLNLQAERIADPAARAVFLESQSRVRAMALVHETLYGSESLARIELPRYLARLCDSLLQTFGGSDRVSVERDVAHVDLELDRALPVGLVVSELVSNALKYAFPGGRRGRVRVALAPQGEADLEVSVSDDGVGLPPELDFDRTTSLGLYLVRILTRQLRGTLAVGRAGVGVTFTLRFPK